MIVLVDTNVVLDALLARRPFDADALKIYAASETGRIDGYICATTVTTIDYIARKTVGASLARTHVRSIMEVFHVAAVTSNVLRAAVSQDFPDFEDSVAYSAAKNVNAQGIVTRNIKDFRKATIPVYEPHQLVALLGL